MRLLLPDTFPDVDVPLEIAASAIISVVQTGLPGTELVVILPNNYGLSLIHGRHGAYCDEHTVEAQLAWFPDPDLDVFTPAFNTGLLTNAGPSLQARADGEWLAEALRALAAL